MFQAEEKNLNRMKRIKRMGRRRHFYRFELFRGKNNAEQFEEKGSGVRCHGGSGRPAFVFVLTTNRNE
jgi:hypothetical protein